MNYRLDPELAPALAALAAQAAGATPPARGDWQAVRTAASAGLAQLASITPPSSGVTTTSFSTVTSDGRDEIELRWYTPANAKPGPAVVYTHGGGMLGGSVDLYDELVSWYAAESTVPFLSVELRLAPEATSPTSLAEDVFAALTWLVAAIAALTIPAVGHKAAVGFLVVLGIAVAWYFARIRRMHFDTIDVAEVTEHDPVPEIGVD